VKCIETITLRSLRKDNRQLVDELVRQFFTGKGPGLPASIKVYYHACVETDLSIHIHWEAEVQHPSEESALGQSLFYALKGLGRVSHSLWVEAVALE
jgi:hypothetical protein